MFCYSETHKGKESVFLRGWQIVGGRREKGENKMSFTRLELSIPYQTQIKTVCVQIIRPTVNLLGKYILP